MRVAHVGYVFRGTTSAYSSALAPRQLFANCYPWNQRGSMLVNVIKDVRGLIAEVVSRLGAQPVYNSIGRDKNTVKRWIEGTAQPSEPKNVAAILHLALKNGVDVSPFQAFCPIYDFSPHLT